MTDALFIYIKGEQALSDLPPSLAEKARTQWERMGHQTELMDREIQFCRDHKIQIICYSDTEYPERLRICPDAPLVLFYLGNAPLNSRHIISIVGTRQITPYGKLLCQKILEDIGRLLPDALIVSGLAYGVDIHAHRAALANGLSTIGVLAHGLDRIYPQLHKSTATDMTRQGGLLTEYPMGVGPERYNFVHRNRIVAALSDATIVIESAARGGSMITADLARQYGRLLVACPGRAYDPYSEGCNRAIAEGRALLYTDIPDLVNRLGWQVQGGSTAVQQSLFPILSPEEQTLMDALKGSDGLTADKLEAATGMAAFKVSALMMEMEMQGLVSVLPGGVYCAAQ